MKNRRGEIATLLTLGLVLVGAVATIATSIFTNNQKNIASNPKASGVNCLYGSSSECTSAIKMGECGSGYGGTTCPKCSNGTYRCPGTTDNTLASGTSRTQHTCPNNSSKFYYELSGKYYMTSTSTTSYTSITSICGSSTDTSCVGTAQYHTCKSDNPAYTNGGYYINSQKYYEDSKCKTLISQGVGNFCKSKNPNAGGQQAPDKLCCKVYDCKSGKQQIKAVGKLATPENGNVGYTNCGTTGYSGDVRECSSIPGAPTTNGADTYVNCSTGQTDPGGSTNPVGGGPGDVGPGQSCCFTKKGLIYEYATYQSMVNNTMPLDCSRQTGALVKSYQALDPPGAFVCKTGSAGSPYDDSQIIEPDDGSTPEEDNPGNCQDYVDASSCGKFCAADNYGWSCKAGKVDSEKKWCCTSGGSTSPACPYTRQEAISACGSSSDITNEGCSSGTYRCKNDAPPGGNAINYGNPITCSNNPAVKYYKSGGKYYKSTSDTTGSYVFKDVCPDPVVDDDNQPAGGGAVNCKDTAKYASRQCGFLNSSIKICTSQKSYYFPIGSNTDTNTYGDDCSVIGSNKDGRTYWNNLDNYCNCQEPPQGFPNNVDTSPDSQVRATNGIFYQCKKIGTFDTKAMASNTCVTCSSWLNSLRGHVNCAVTREGTGDSKTFTTYCCDLALPQQ